MNRTRWFIAVVLILLASIYVGCNVTGVHEQESQIKNVEFTSAEQQVLRSGNRFGFRFFKRVNRFDTARSNIITSPLSASMALGMTLNGSDGETRDAMKKTLGVKGQSMQSINQTYRKTIKKLVKLDPSVSIDLANAIYHPRIYNNDTLRLQETFQNNVTEYFDAKLSNDFRKEAINGWVDDKTRGNIKKLVDRLTPRDIMVLLNALYFNGKWTHAFNDEDTYAGSFEAVGGETEVNYMKREGGFAFKQTESYQLADLAYGDSLFSMTVVMPMDGKSLDEVISRLDYQQWSQWTRDLNHNSKAKIHLPRFKFKYEIKLNKVLADMGMEVAFTRNAEFDKIFRNSPGPLKISQVKQKAAIEVTEEGTEAAAATSVEMVRTSVGPPVLYFNQPFLFVIRHYETDTILFMGKVGNP